jgi:hypothetical protein
VSYNSFRSALQQNATDFGHIVLPGNPIVHAGLAVAEALRNLPSATSA